MKRESLRKRSLSDRMISGSRSAWYGATEPIRLRFARSGIDGSHKPAPCVSVLIPTHNRKDLLAERCLPSVLGQTHRPLQVIVACHGCTDGTIEALRDWRKRDARLHWFDVERTQTYPPTAINHWLAGPVAPLNAALKHATGDWLARIDDDDQWRPDHIEHMLKFAHRRDYEFVSAAYAVHEDGITRVVAHDGGNPRIGGTQTWLWRSYLRFMRWNPDCWRKAWHAVNDTDLAQRMRNAGVRIGHDSYHIGADVYPRPGETAVGSRAYLENEAEVEQRLAFE